MSTHHDAQIDEQGSCFCKCHTYVSAAAIRRSCTCEYPALGRLDRLNGFSSGRRAILANSESRIRAISPIRVKTYGFCEEHGRLLNSAGQCED